MLKLLILRKTATKKIITITAKYSLWTHQHYMYISKRVNQLYIQQHVTAKTVHSSHMGKPAGESKFADAAAVGSGGDDLATNGAGILHLAASDTFDYIDSNSQQCGFRVTTRFLEVCKGKKVRDLLSDGAVVQVRGGSEDGFFAKSKEVEIKTYGELLRALSPGQKLRRVAPTKMNDRSSRSHVMITIKIESRKKHNKRPGLDCNDV